MRKMFDGCGCGMPWCVPCAVGDRVHSVVALRVQEAVGGLIGGYRVPPVGLYWWFDGGEPRHEVLELRGVPLHQHWARMCMAASGPGGRAGASAYVAEGVIQRPIPESLGGTGRPRFKAYPDGLPVGQAGVLLLRYDVRVAGRSESGEACAGVERLVMGGVETCMVGAFSAPRERLSILAWQGPVL